MQMKYEGRVLALGDSYTIGEGVEADERWIYFLVELLKSKGLEFQSPQIIAKTGWTTTELIDAVKQESPSGNFDLVTLLIGVNNQYRGLSPEEYTLEFTKLLTQAITFAGGESQHVLVLSIPDWGKTPFAGDRDVSRISSDIDEFNKINLNISKALQVNYCNITSLSRTFYDDAYLVADQLHYSGKMYALWAEEAMKVIQNSLF